MKNNRLTAEYIKNVARMMRIFNLGAVSALVAVNGNLKTFELIRLGEPGSKQPKWNMAIREPFGSESYDKMFDCFKEMIEEFKTTEFYMAEII